MKPADKLIKDSKHFCILPWIHFHGWPNGQVMPCCVADSQMPVSRIEDDVSILDMMNSEKYREMRVKMMNDEYVPECRRCYELEAVGTWTMRKSQNAVRGEDCIDILEDTNMDGSIDEFQMRYMDIRFSNLCNMKCRSCGPSCSNLWGEEKIEEYGKEEMLRVFDLTDVHVSNNSNGVFMDKLKGHLGDVQECYFAGGEILVTPEHYECLDYWVENNLQDQVHLNYTTNMSKLTYRDKQGTRDLFDYWKQFPNIEIWASLDSIGPEAELIRKGTRWNKIVDNLKRIKEEAPHIRLGFTPTISIWNIWNYHKLFDFLMDEGIMDPNIPPRLNILTNPEWANIKILPEFAIAKLREIYYAYELKYDLYNGDAPYNNGMSNTFKVLNAALNECSPNPDKFLEFILENDKMDRSRAEQVIETLPELKEIYEWARTESSQ